jgi:hypothetical protein
VRAAPWRPDSRAPRSPAATAAAPARAACRRGVAVRLEVDPEPVDVRGVACHSTSPPARSTQLEVDARPPGDLRGRRARRAAVAYPLTAPESSRKTKRTPAAAAGSAASAASVATVAARTPR